MAKITLPINRGCRASTLMSLNGSDIVLSGHTNGSVYQEWEGLVDPLGPIDFEILTPDKYPGGIGRQTKSPRFWVHHQAGSADQRMDVYVIQRSEGQNDNRETRNVPWARREPTSVNAMAFGEAFQYGVKIRNPQSSIGVDLFVGEYEDAGPSTAAGEP